MGSMVLPHLQNAWQVDQAILSEDERLVVVRFGRDSHPDWYVSFPTNALSCRHFTFILFFLLVLLTYEFLAYDKTMFCPKLQTESRILPLCICAILSRRRILTPCIFPLL
jgi:hypothetical protein